MNPLRAFSLPFARHPLAANRQRASVYPVVALLLGLIPAISLAGTLATETSDYVYPNYPTFTVTAAGANTVTGNLGPTPTDPQDGFNVTIPTGQTVTSISYTGATTDSNGASLIFYVSGCGVTDNTTFNQPSLSATNCTLSFTESTNFQTSSFAWTVTINTINTPSSAPTTVVSTASLSADTGTSSSDFITNTASQIISGTLSANLASGESVEVSYDGGATWSNATSYTVGSNNWSDTTTLSGSNTFEARVTNVIGSSTVYTHTYTLDTTAPTVTPANISITGASGTGGAYKIGDTVTASWNNTAGGDNNVDVATVTVDFSQFGGGSAVTASNSSGTWTATYVITSGAIDATNRNVSVTATDSAGNTTTTADTTNATVDNIPPTVTDMNISISGASGTGGAFKVGDTVTATWNDTAAGDNNTDTISSVTVDFSQFGGGSAVTASNSSGTWTATYTITSGAIDATNRNVSVTATDNAGNTKTTADTTNATVDNIPPSVTISATIITDTGSTGTISSGGVTKDNTLGLSGTVSDTNGISSVQIYDGATLLGSATVGGGSWSYTTAALADGSHSFTAKATDSAGNTTTTSPVTATIDTIAAVPVITGMSTDSGISSTDGITSDTTPTLSGTAEANATVTLYRDGTQVGTATADGSGNWNFTSAALGEGSYSFTATATDTLGNVSAQSAAKSVTIDTTTPTVTDANITISGASGTGGAFKIGDVVNASWNNTSGGDNNPDVSTVSVDFSQFGGGSDVAASNSSGTWTASYTITSGTINGTNLNVSVTSTDYAGNITTTADTSNATVNNTPPVVTAPADVTVDATGLFTAVDIGTATAVDANGATLSTSSDAPANFAPGTYTITWSATDATGNTGTATQTVNVVPLVSFDKDQTTAEGGTVTFRVILNGPAASYPVTVPYTVGGTSSNDGSDYGTAPLTGTVTISSGTEASVSFTTVNDGPGEGTETIVLTMGTPTNAVKGSHSVDTIEIVEGNVAPEVSLSADQGAGETRTVVTGDGPVTVSSTVVDPNPGDTHSYDWSGSDNALVDTDSAADSFTFAPSGLTPGIYTLRLNVSDGTASDSVALSLNVVASAPSLSATNDSDGDGINDATDGYGDSDGDGIPNYLDAISSSNVLQEISGDSTSNLIETEAGLRIGLGAIAFRSDQGQAGVTVTAVTTYGGGIADSEYSYNNGVFDFIVDGLPDAGQSVQVVIPQLATIPANALYRKVINGLWQAFVEDANNAIASAPGADGYCPPPGDSAYTPGLTEGNWCVQLTIEDGGPNDTDGQANNSVADPGGVAVWLQKPVTVSVSSGGGASTPWLLALLGLLLWRVKLLRKEVA